MSIRWNASSNGNFFLTRFPGRYFSVHGNSPEFFGVRSFFTIGPSKEETSQFLSPFPIFLPRFERNCSDLRREILVSAYKAFWLAFSQ